MAGIVAGRFTDRREVDRASAALRAAGFSPESISVIPQARENLGPPFKASRTSTIVGAIIGAIIGAALAAVIAFVISVYIAHHTIGVTVVWLALIGAVIGLVIGGLIGSGKAFVRSEYRRRAIWHGRMTLTVDAGGRPTEAKDILMRFGGSDVRDVFSGGPGEYHAPPDTSHGAPA